MQISLRGIFIVQNMKKFSNLNVKLDPDTQCFSSGFYLVVLSIQKSFYFLVLKAMTSQS